MDGIGENYGLQRGGGVWYTEGRRKGNAEVIKRQ